MFARRVVGAHLAHERLCGLGGDASERTARGVNGVMEILIERSEIRILLTRRNFCTYNVFCHNIYFSASSSSITFLTAGQKFVRVSKIYSLRSVFYLTNSMRAASMTR